MGSRTIERALTKPDGSTNKGAFGRSVRLIQEDEYRLILTLGFSQAVRGIPESARDLVVAESADYDRPIIEQLVSRPFRDAAFAETVRQAYHSTCAMTGLRLINGGGSCEIEAAHIRPVGDNHHGPDSIRNGLALSRTFHWLFDRGLITVADDFSIVIANGMVPESLTEVLNPSGRLLVPDDAAVRPHPVFLRYHRSQIYKG